MRCLPRVPFLILALAHSSCSRPPPAKPEKAAEAPPAGQTVIYDPEGMQRIGKDAGKAEFKIKDYYVNALAVEFPVQGPGDEAFLRELESSPPPGVPLFAVSSEPGAGALSHDEALRYRDELLAVVPFGGGTLQMEWVERDTVEVSNRKGERLRLPEREALGRITDFFARSREGVNGWVSLPPHGEGNAGRLRRLLGSIGKVSGLERVLVFVVPVGGRGAAPLLLASSRDLQARGTLAQILPTLKEAFHSDSLDRKDEASPPSPSLFRSFRELQPAANRIGVAYFLGGRTAILYRSFLSERFLKAGLDVELYSKSLYDRKGGGFLTHKDYYRIPREEVFTKGQFKATGIELIELMMSTENIGASIGETAFLQGLARGVPMVAVAELGFDAKEQPGHAMVLCKNLPYRSGADLQGKKFGARRSAGGDELFLREFISSVGLDPSKDVSVFGNMPDDKLGKAITTGELDGMYAHLMSIPGMPKHCRVIRKLDWINPEISSALLVFPKTWLARNRAQVKKLLRAMVEQIAAERKMTRSQRRDRKRKDRKGIEIEMDREDMQLPTVRALPTVRTDLLEELKRLFLKHGIPHVPEKITPFVDNSLLLEVEAELSASR